MNMYSTKPSIISVARSVIRQCVCVRLDSHGGFPDLYAHRWRHALHGAEEVLGFGRVLHGEEDDPAVQIHCQFQRLAAHLTAPVSLHLLVIKL